MTRALNANTLFRPRRARKLRESRLDAWVRRRVHGWLAALPAGGLVVEEDGRTTTFGYPSTAASVARVHVHHPSVYRAILLRGTLGAGEAYMHGHWSSPDPVAVVRFMAANLSTWGRVDRRRPAWSRWPLQWLHRLRANTVAGARRNIAAHYDLSNEFFGLFLDADRMYSSAIFPRPDASLEEASRFKRDYIARRLRLKPSDHLLEIGTGWGGMAIYAAEHFGCRVTTTTLSRAQYDYAREQIRARGLEDRITLLLRDYRHLEGRYDKLVSIEMIEAVGHEYLPGYFRHCYRLLKPDGLALIQAITIPDQRYEQSRRSVDFIRRYVFPGGCLPSLGRLQACLGEASALHTVAIEDMTEHYARTLQCWRERFNARRNAVRALGFDDTFIRLWEFYLAYCEGGFRERVIHTHQLLLAGPQCRALPMVAGTRTAGLSMSSV